MGQEFSKSHRNRLTKGKFLVSVRKSSDMGGTPQLGIATHTFGVYSPIVWVKIPNFLGIVCIQTLPPGGLFVRNTGIPDYQGKFRHHGRPGRKHRPGATPPPSGGRL